MVKLVSRSPTDAPTSAPTSAGADQDEAATSYADLASEAAAIDSGLTAPGAGSSALAIAAPDPIEAQAKELIDVLTLARQIVSPMFAWWPDFAAVWSDAQLASVANGGAQVMAKHGWTTGALFAEYGPYIALGVATIPPAIATHHAIKARQAQAAAEQAQARARAARGDRGDPQ